MEHTKRRLRTYVHVRRDDQDHGTWFGPDDDLPEWAVEQLADNPRVWADDTELEDPPPPAQSMIGGVFEEGSLVSTPMRTTTGLLPPSSTPSSRPSRGSGRPQAPAAGAEPGLAEAERRFAPSPGDAA